VHPSSERERDRERERGEREKEGRSGRGGREREPAIHSGREEIGRGGWRLCVCIDVEDVIRKN